MSFQTRPSNWNSMSRDEQQAWEANDQALESADCERRQAQEDADLARQQARGELRRMQRRMFEASEEAEEEIRSLNAKLERVTAERLALLVAAEAVVASRGGAAQLQALQLAIASNRA